MHAALTNKMAVKNPAQIFLGKPRPGVTHNKGITIQPTNNFTRLAVAQGIFKNITQYQIKQNRVCLDMHIWRNIQI